MPEPAGSLGRCRIGPAIGPENLVMADAKQMVDALVRERRGSSIPATAVLGGLALVTGLAVRALQGGSSSAPDQEARTSAADANATAQTPFDHSDVSEDEARIMLRAMVAAT